MNFDELDTRMRVFETAHDYCVFTGICMVARIDGQGIMREGGALPVSTGR